jgi:hypothetical protein
MTLPSRCVKGETRIPARSGYDPVPHDPACSPNATPKAGEFGYLPTAIWGICSPAFAA